MSAVRSSRLLTLLIALLSTRLFELPNAQSLSRPNVAITKLPTLQVNTWPADVNEDGIIDLVGSAGDERNPDLVVSLGRGDGTFADAQRAGAQMAPVTVGDFNADAHLDIIVTLTDDGSSYDLYVMAGRGDATFAPPMVFSGRDVTGFVPNGMSADFNGDGHRDLAVMAQGDSAVHIFHGNGDLTFAPPITLAASPNPRQFVVSDLNADGRPDVGVAAEDLRVVDLFLNTGTGFAYSQIPFTRRVLGITVADMDRDGIRDLIVSTGQKDSFQLSTFINGFVEILRGRGDGTFGPASSFPTNMGPVTAVVGDYNGDGVTDVATGNRSIGWNNVCEEFANLWDSVSILPGFGNGTVGPAETFALDNAPPEAINLYQDTHTALKTSDFNADGRSDLIATRGAILLGAPTSANRPPVANAGPDQDNVIISPDFRLRGSATDADSDWLRWEWTDQSGNVLGTWPTACVFNQYQGSQTFTLTVRDNRGGVATDTVTYQFESSLPEGWASQDVEDASGFSGFDGERYSIQAAGADIWGTEDEFHFVNTGISGDFEFTAFVPFVENVAAWTKAGLMIRDGLAADARHASIFATPGRGVAFQRRPLAGGTSVHTAGPAVAPPVWLRLTRRGDLVVASMRAAGATAWTPVGEQRFAALPGFVNVGLALSSHVEGRRAGATFEQVTLVSLESDLPAGWTATDVGAVGAEGRSSVNEDRGLYSVTGSGADVWATADEFHFLSREITGDFDFSARMAHVDDVDGWTKAGLMMREGLAANARHAFIIQTPRSERGIAYQRRPTAGGTSVHTAGPANAPPRVLRLVRAGSVVTAYQRSETEVSWSLVGTQTFTELPATVRIGFAVTSHVDGTLANAFFDEVGIAQPSVWQSSDIGAVAARGGSLVDGPEFTVHGSGADVWDTADELHFLSREVTGDFDFSARAAVVKDIDRWTKAGLMMRDGLATNARHAFLLQTPRAQQGVAFQRRPVTGSTSVHTAGPANAPPGFLRVVREGDLVSAYYRSEPTGSWMLIGTQTFTALPATVRIGFAVSSHVDGTIASATFDNFVLTQ
jgi:hypothetical protein